MSVVFDVLDEIKWFIYLVFVKTLEQESFVVLGCGSYISIDQELFTHLGSCQSDNGRNSSANIL